MSIDVADFTKTYDRTTAVAGLSFRVEPGEILGLVGPNGAGKTTTMRALAGVPDDPHLFGNLTVWEHFRFIAAAYRLRDWHARGAAILDAFQLGEQRDEPCSDLSRGMRQKVAIGCGYLREPAVLMLDEPLTGLDPRGIRTMRDSIRDRAAAGAAVMISSHLLGLVEDLCTTVLLLDHGRKAWHGRLDEWRATAGRDGSDGSLEALFLRLTAAGA